MRTDPCLAVRNVLSRPPSSEKGSLFYRPAVTAADASVLPEPALGQPPKPEKVKALPTKYLSLSGSHDAHPGTGKGYRAVSRQRAIKAVA
jgi:hypothetical protein